MAPLNAMSVSELESWQNNYNAQRRARITGTGLWARWRRWRMPTWLKVLLVLALMAGLVVIVYYVAIALCAITPKIRKGLGLDEHGRVKGKGKGPGGSYLNN